MKVEILAHHREAGQTLVLRRRGEHYEVILGNVVLLSSAALETEHAFGALAGRLAPTAASPRVLVGGLGFGATLAGALDATAAGARVMVAEKLAAIPALLRAHRPGPHADGLLDPRAELVVDDVAAVMDGHPGSFDAILLDVDNGPEWASFRGNAALYGEAGLARARRALRPGGFLAVWSGYPKDAFLARLRAAGFRPENVPLRERGVVRARAYVGWLSPP
jgi:spermidine synthase